MKKFKEFKQTPLQKMQDELEHHKKQAAIALRKGDHVAASHHSKQMVDFERQIKNEIERT